jgi:hypothetical protein
MSGILLQLNGERRFISIRLKIIKKTDLRITNQLLYQLS